MHFYLVNPIMSIQRMKYGTKFLIIEYIHYNKFELDPKKS